jgi:hypothetical protein
MTNREEAKAVITASYILYMINVLLDPADKMNVSTIRLNSLLQSKTRVAKFNDYVILSNSAWAIAVDKFKEDNLHVVIFQAVETLWFNNIDVMVKMFGQHSTDVVLRFVTKQHSNGNVDNKYIAETNLVIDELTKQSDKVIFDFQKGINNERNEF